MEVLIGEVALRITGNDDVAIFWKERKPKVAVDDDVMALNLPNPSMRNMQYLTFDLSLLYFLCSFGLEKMIGIELRNIFIYCFKNIPFFIDQSTFASGNGKNIQEIKE